MVVMNASDGACHCYYASKSRFDSLSGCPLFHLPDKRLDALKYFGLYKFGLRIGTDPVMTFIGLRRCGEVFCGRTDI